MNVRPATLDEARTLTEIATEAKRYWGYSEQAMDSFHSTLTLEAEKLDLSPPFVVEVDSRIVGFYQLIADGARMELQHLWVEPEHMNQGIGKLLMAHAVAQARVRGAKTITIDATANAVAFFLSCGARRIGESPAPASGETGRARQLLEIALVGRQ